MAPAQHASVVGAIDRASRLLHRPGRHLIGVAGVPGSGKSTLAHAVADAIGAEATVVPMDGFHLSNRALDSLGLRDWKGRVDTFDGWGYLQLVRRLRTETTHTVYAPSFERELEQPLAGALAVAPTCRLVISEGNYLLCDGEPWRELRTEFDEIWFCEMDESLRMQRLVERHVRFGKTPAIARDWVERVDQANAAMIAPTGSAATVIVHT